MKESLAGLEAALLVILLWNCHRLHLPKVLYFYFAAQLVFTVLCLGATQKVGWSGALYRATFHLSLTLVCISALFLTAWFCRTMPSLSWATSIALSCAVLCTAAVASFIESFRARGVLSEPILANILSAGVLVYCGLIGLISMAFPSETIADWIRGVVSLFWLATGGEGLLESGLYLRSRSLALSRISGFPIVLAIMAFGFLSYLLASQSELSRQPGQTELQEVLDDSSN